MRPLAPSPQIRNDSEERIMLLKMVGQGLLAAALVATLAYGYQTYRDARIDGAFPSAVQEDDR